MIWDSLPDKPPGEVRFTQPFPQLNSTKLAAEVQLRYMDDLAPHLIIDNEDSFLTSDSPVFLYNQFNQGITDATNAVDSHGFQAFFPISPKIVLMLYDPQVYEIADTKAASQLRSKATAQDIIPTEPDATPQCGTKHIRQNEENHRNSPSRNHLSRATPGKQRTYQRHIPKDKDKRKDNHHIQPVYARPRPQPILHTSKGRRPKYAHTVARVPLQTPVNHPKEHLPGLENLPKIIEYWKTTMPGHPDRQSKEPEIRHEQAGMTRGHPWKPKREPSLAFFNAAAKCGITTMG